MSETNVSYCRGIVNVPQQRVQVNRILTGAVSMNTSARVMKTWTVIFLLASASTQALAGETTLVSLRDFRTVELKYAGFQLLQPAAIHVKALGGGGERGWTYSSDKMFAYGWIINADSRSLVWSMGIDNTTRIHDDREFDGTVQLAPGSYEVYFVAYAFAYHSAFTHIVVNVDHRRSPLFGEDREHDKGFFSWLTGLWSDDIAKEWENRAPHWGIDLLVDDGIQKSAKSFPPPKAYPNAVINATGLGEHELIRKGFTLTEPLTLTIHALGEATGENEMADFGWIVDAANRKRVWEMDWDNTSPAGGADKNVQFSGDVSLPKGDYVLYYVTDGSHSVADWNDCPPNDPLHWGVCCCVKEDRDKKALKTWDYDEDKNLVVGLTKVKDNAYLTRGFTLKGDCRLRIYAFGERNNDERTMADYGAILNANTRDKVWTMDVDRTYPGGGAPKNRFVDEVINLPKGNYLVTYTTDDSHAYGEWNADQPFDPEHYGISLMGVGSGFQPSLVTEYVEKRDKNIIAQIIRVGDNADASENFTLDRMTRVRIYALGEGRDRDMYDYGWIEDAKTGNVIWEMTYGMTFYAGGGRKNRMVNTTVMLDKGEYRLRYRSDDSHAYGDWNVDPPDDQQYWGITLYKDAGHELPPQPRVPTPAVAPPVPPTPPQQRVPPGP